MQTKDLPFDAEFIFVTGPLEGCYADSMGHWREHYGVESYASADDDMKQRFKYWCQEEGHAPSEDSWGLWLMSWEDEEVED